MVNEVVKEFGRIDHLVHSAGVSQSSFQLSLLLTLLVDRSTILPSHPTKLHGRLRYRNGRQRKRHINH